MPVRFPKRWFRKKRVILASGSPRRKELMELTGLKFQVIPPDVDERVLPEETPKDHVERLALQKAVSVAANNPDDVVETTQVGTIEFEILGCDDAMATVTLDGQDPVMYTAKQLTRPFPCTDEE